MENNEINSPNCQKKVHTFDKQKIFFEYQIQECT